MPDENNETTIKHLLRLKRYEQPPTEYFDRFLRDFQRRQRSEMLRQPLWRLVLERAQTFFGEHSLGHRTHAFAMSIILLLGGLAALNVTLPSNAPTVVAQSVASADTRPAGGMNMSLDTTVPQPDFQAVARNVNSRDSQALVRPHYVMDTRPVSYEPPFSF